MTTVEIEERPGRWLVVLVSDTGYRTVVGRHSAKFRAIEQRDSLLTCGDEEVAP